MVNIKEKKLPLVREVGRAPKSDPTFNQSDGWFFIMLLVILGITLILRKII